jgi:actin-related protein
MHACVQLAQQTTATARTFALPDGQRIRLATERFQAPEVLFQPAVMGFEGTGLSDAVHACIHALPIDVRRDMYSTILLGGGHHDAAWPLLAP